MKELKKKLSAAHTKDLLVILQERFEKNRRRHSKLEWDDIREKLLAHPSKLWSLAQMEESGGEPDVIGYDTSTGEYIFCDCSAETPAARRNVCYDRQALDARKEHKPKNSAMDMADAMGVDLLTEEEYRNLQTLGEFDTKTSSWVATDADVRKLGGAFFCDRRYGRVFLYHNGAQSYYAVRGFRASLRV